MKRSCFKGSFWGKEEIINRVILSLIQDLQRLSLQLVNSMRGRCPAGRPLKYGMTSLCHSGGFTLIELLVVVLIIGILAAVAVPQYQKAVAKSRLATAMAPLKALQQAEDTCFLETGSACPLENLSVEHTAQNYKFIDGYGTSENIGSAVMGYSVYTWTDSDGKETPLIGLNISDGWDWVIVLAITPIGRVCTGFEGSADSFCPKMGFTRPVTSGFLDETYLSYTE